jgi:hypothetical protein
VAVTLEQVLTHPKAFGLVSATPVQRALCRVADGLPLGELACDPAVVRALGGADALAFLPRTMPKELYVVAAIRCGKSLICAALAVRAALTCNLDGLGMHEVARVSIVSLDLDKAQVVLEHLMGATLRSALHGRVVGTPKAKSVRLRREDGRVVEIMVVAGKRAGGSLVSRWSAGAIFDEAPRMQGERDGVVNFDQMRLAVLGRLRPGAQLVAVGSPWRPAGPIYDAVQTSWGKPSAHLVVLRATGPEMNPIVWTPAASEELRKQDEGAYRTDVLGEFADAESAFFTDTELKGATREAPLTLEREAGISYGAAMDPAISGNAWTLVIAGKRPAKDEAAADYFVARTRQWQGSKLEPLKAKAVFEEIQAELAAYGLSEVYTDQWAAHLVTEIGEQQGVTVTTDDGTQAEKAHRYLDFRERLMGGHVELAPDPVLRADLLSVRKRVTTTGLAFDLPVTRDGRHADFAPAVVLCIEVAAHSVSWVHAVTQWRRAGAPAF